MSENSSSKLDTQGPRALTFDFIKSSQFRVVHAEGAFGGQTPRGQLFFSLYNERQAIPQQTTNAVGPDGMLGEELRDQRVGRPGIVREVEVGVLMSPSDAETLANWLLEHVKRIRGLEAQQNAKQ